MRTALTNDAGEYAFSDLPPGVYTVTADQPTAFIDGIETQGTPKLGSIEQDQFVDLDLVGNFAAVDYLFGELGLKAEFTSKAMFLSGSTAASEYIRQLRIALGDDWTQPHSLAPSNEIRAVTDSELDVNGDGYLSPIDALLVINHLN